MVLKPAEGVSDSSEGVVQDRHRPAEQRWSGIVGAGQSLSTGVHAQLETPTVAAGDAYRLEDSTQKYDISCPSSSTLSLAPFTEPFRTVKGDSNAYPTNIDGKTPQHAMALQISFLCQQAGITPPVQVHTCVGKGGAAMFEITKDGTANAYEASIYEADALRRLAAEKPHKARLEYDAIVLTHGETDALLGHTTYADELIKLQKAYAQDLKRITGQTNDPILILSQQSSFPWVPKAGPPQIIQDQWWAQRMTPDDSVVCAGPKYQYGYADGVHLYASGYDRLGQKYGQVFFETVIRHRTWEPLSPKLIELTAPNKIQASFRVPVPPLRWDEALLEHAGPLHQHGQHSCWAAGRGFEVRDGSLEKIGIVDVQIEDDSVVVTLDTTDYVKPLTLSYAMSVDVEQPSGGTGDGRLGFLCDSDTTPSASGETRTCQLTHGSREVTCAAGWDAQAPWDLVFSDGDAQDNCLIGFDADEPQKAYLWRPWQGASGSWGLAVQHSMRNYCVNFSMPAAWAVGQGL